MMRAIFRNVTRVATVIIFNAILFFATGLIAGGIPEDTEVSKPKGSDRVQIPFIGNNGTIEDKEVAFAAYLTDGTFYIKKDGTLTYIFLTGGKKDTSINEIFTPQKVTLKPLEPPPDEIIALYQQKGYIQKDLVNYYRMSFGEIYPGVDFELIAFTDSLEKRLTLLSGGRPETIKIKVEGSKGLKVDESGVLEIITEGGSAKFTKPAAYQETEGERKPVEISYSITKDATYGFKVGKYDKSKPLKISFNMSRGKDQ